MYKPKETPVKKLYDIIWDFEFAHVGPERYGLEKLYGGERYPVHVIIGRGINMAVYTQIKYGGY